MASSDRRSPPRPSRSGSSPRRSSRYRSCTSRPAASPVPSEHGHDRQDRGRSRSRGRTPRRTPRRRRLVRRGGCRGRPRPRLPGRAGPGGAGRRRSDGPRHGARPADPGQGLQLDGLGVRHAPAHHAGRGVALAPRRHAGRAAPAPRPRRPAGHHLHRWQRVGDAVHGGHAGRGRVAGHRPEDLRQHLAGRRRRRHLRRRRPPGAGRRGDRLRAPPVDRGRDGSRRRGTRAACGGPAATTSSSTTCS